VATSATQLAKSGKFGDLRRRLIFLLLALVVYRIGAHIPVPGIDPEQLRQLFSSQSGGILSLFNMFSGASRCSRSASCRTSPRRSSCS
jgi:preprotein translocase subunit SecY